MTNMLTKISTIAFLLVKPLGTKSKQITSLASSYCTIGSFVRDIIGWNWTNEIHIYCRLQEDLPLITTLQDLLQNLIENHGDLLAEKVVKTKLVRKPLKNTPWWFPSFAHHAVIIVETENQSMSIEKTTSEIQLKLLTDENANPPLATNFRRGEKVQQFIAKPTTVLDLVSYLQTSQSLNWSYNILSSNCQHFASQILQHFAANHQNVYKPFPQIFLPSRNAFQLVQRPWLGLDDHQTAHFNSSSGTMTFTSTLKLLLSNTIYLYSMLCYILDKFLIIVMISNFFLLYLHLTNYCPNFHHSQWINFYTADLIEILKWSWDLYKCS